MKKLNTWHFPLTRTHTGMLLGNGTMGAMIWGQGSVLRITIGRTDFWDHRGGIRWNDRMSYANIRACLDGNDQKGLSGLFSVPEPPKGVPHYPTVLPLGRIELDFGKGARLTQGVLNIADGTATVEVRQGDRRFGVRLVMDMLSPLLCVALPAGLPKPRVKRVTAWDYVRQRLTETLFEEPEMLDAKAISGWIQKRPVDPPLCLGYRWTGSDLCLTTAYGVDPAAARAEACVRLDDGAAAGFAGIGTRARRWWREYWKTVPSVEIPNDRLSFLYHYGMYKLAGLTNPAGVPATLQGPWVEEYQMPPWSCDYHFNINVQMCYWPAYHGNRLEHLKPLFQMIGTWADTMRHNARCFAGVDDGLMLPHSVDDRCTCIGGYWAGSIDHGSTAWVAQMMYRYYRYTMDAQFLRQTAYPFMAGAMRVYEAMIERTADGGFTLPVSVSPEYIAKSGAMWGPDASFQWACIHRLCEDLVEAARILGEPPKPIWQELIARAPRACLVEEKGEKMIALWRGMNLEESHRHHSHLGGIVPFDTLDLDDPEWQKIVHASLNRWIYHGPGLWSGWCVPWAAMIHTRFGQGEAAELLLESWQRVFTNEGHGTLHDGHIPGYTLFGPAYGRLTGLPAIHRCEHEIMQMDAGMSATAAIQEMLLHTRRGVNYVFRGAPARWRNAAFAGMRTDGAFLVSASREGGLVESVRVESPTGGVFRLANPWDGPAVTCRKGGRREAMSGSVLEIATAAGEVVEIRPDAAKAARALRVPRRA